MAKGRISPRLLLNVSTVYTDVNRSLIEPVDNSIDDATEIYIKGLTDIRTKLRDIEIIVEIIGHNYKKGMIKIKDNCRGMKELKKVVENIGNSDKRNKSYKNGQFGYGLISTMSVANKLEIITQHESNSYSEYITITRDDFLTDDIDLFDFTIRQRDKIASGTEIILSEFNKDKWEEINEEVIREEIQNHFDLLLREPNIKIITVDKNKHRHTCQPYDYSKGHIYDKDIVVEIDKYKGGVISLDKFKIYLCLIPRESLSRPVVLICNKRRIIDLNKISYFRSNNKRTIWNHTSITGFIDIGKLVQPTIARNDLQKSKYLSKILNAIVKDEENILKWIEGIMASTRASDFSEIESIFNSKLNRLASPNKEIESKIDEKEFVSTSDFGETKDVLLYDPNGKEDAVFLINDSKSKSSKGYGKYEDKLRKFKEKLLKSSKCKETVSKLSNDDLRLRIDDSVALPKDKEGNELRSELFGNEVYIYKQHPDFLDRVKTDLHREIVTDKLVSYMTSEVLIHFTNYHFQTNNKDRIVSVKEALQFFTENYYRLEKSMSELVGKPLGK